MERQPAEKTPMEWIDKLFDCMSQFYGNRWDSRYDKFMPISLAKTLWQSGLTGLTYDEIKHGLVLLNRAAQDPKSIPPIHLEFYRYAKGIAKPLYRTNEEILPRGNPEVAKKALDDIRSRLHAV